MRWGIVATLIVLALGRCKAGDVRVAEDTPQMMEFMLRGMLAERQKIQRGEFRISGRIASKSRDVPEKDIDGPLKIIGAFDNEKSRWDVSEPGWILLEDTLRPDPTHPEMARGTSKKGLVARKSIRTKEKSACWLIGARSVSLNRPDAMLLGDVTEFDVRALGLYSWSEFQKKMALEELINGYLVQGSAKSVTEQEAGRCELSFAWGTRSVWKIWIVPSQGFTPVKAEFHESFGAAEKRTWKVTQTFQTEWRNIDDVWVPTHHEFTAENYGGEYSQSVVCDIEWESVNRPVEPSLFDYESFGAPASLPVIDSSLDTPIVVKSPGEDRRIAVRPASFRVWLIGVNAIVVVVLVIYWMRRRIVTLPVSR